MPGEPEYSLDDRRVCAVCSVPLNYREAQGWHHPGSITPFDHPAVPVDPTELASIAWRCDFCTSSHARWAMPVDTFETPTGDVSVGDWCVCDGCKPAVEARDWQTVVRRVQREFRAAGRIFGEPHVFFMLTLYASLQQNITGPLYLNPPTARKEG